MYQFFRQVMIRCQEKRKDDDVSLQTERERERHVDWIIWQAYSHIGESVVFIRTSVYSTHLNVNFTTSQLFPRPTPTNFQLAVRWHQKNTLQLHCATFKLKLYIYILVTSNIFLPNKKKSNPQKKKHHHHSYLDFPPFFGCPFSAPSGASTSTGTVSSTGNGISSSTGAAAMAGTDALPSSSRGFLAAGLAGFKVFPGENAFGFEKWRFINVLWIY